MLTRSLTRPLTRPITRGLAMPGGGGGVPNTEATIVILLGQSLNSPFDTTVLATDWTETFMAVDGAAVTDFDYYATNATWCPDWDSVASAVTFTEGVLQSPLAGITTTLKAGPRPSAYLASVSIPSRGVEALNSGGPRCAMVALVFRLCDIAVAAGKIPKVVFYSAHGEADAFAGMSEATYYTLAMDYYRACQAYAAMAMGDPSYVAPVLLTYPVQQAQPSGTGVNDQAIKEAIRRIGQDLDGAVDAGAIYQWPVRSDRVHPTDVGYVQRGEAIGRIIAGNASPAPYITGVTLSGNTFVATFSENMVRDTTLGIGTSLNAANQRDGFEWLDNGTFISISALIYSGATVTGTLATTPVGTLGQQVLRIAQQATTSTLVAGAANRPGSQVRADAAGWVSTYDPSYTNYRYAIPQRITNVSAA